MEKLSGNAAESGNGICPAVRSAAAFADQRRQPLGMEPRPVAVGKGGELRCGPMKKSCNTPFGSKHPTPERRSILFHSLADLIVKSDNKNTTKKPAVQQEISCFVPPVFCIVMPYLHFLKIIHAHISGDVLSCRLFAAVLFTCRHAIPP